VIITQGRLKYKIPTTLHKNDVLWATTSRSPEWMVSMDNLCKSTVESYLEYTILLGWFCESSRYINGDLAGNLFTSGAIKSSDLVIVIPNGEHGPKIEQRLYSGKVIQKLVIVRLGWTEGKNEKLQQITFGEVRIIGYQQNVQYLVIYSQITSKENDIQIFKQKDGATSGHKVSSVDYSTNKLEMK
jgi:hypothetical protein